METLGLAPAGKLYTPRQISVAALLGAPAAAGWFISRNETQLGRPHQGRRWFWGCVLGTVALIGVSFVLPANFPRFVLPTAYVVGFNQAARQLYGSVVQTHLAAGGMQGSWWQVICVGLIFLVAFMTVIFVVVLLLPADVAG